MPEPVGRDHQRRAAPGAEPGVERVDRRALVVAQFDHLASAEQAQGIAGAGSSAASIAPTGLAGPSPFTPFSQTGTVDSECASDCGRDAVLERDRDHDAGVVDEGRHRRAGLLAVGEHLERPPGVVVADADGEGLAAEGDVADRVAPAVGEPGPRHRSPAILPGALRDVEYLGGRRAALHQRHQPLLMELPRRLQDPPALLLLLRRQDDPGAGDGIDEALAPLGPIGPAAQLGLGHAASSVAPSIQTVPSRRR